MQVKLETASGKLVAEGEVPDANVSPGVLFWCGRVFAKINGKPAFPWMPTTYRETTSAVLQESRNVA